MQRSTEMNTKTEEGIVGFSPFACLFAYSSPRSQKKKEIYVVYVLHLIGNKQKNRKVKEFPVFVTQICRRCVLLKVGVIFKFFSRRYLYFYERENVYRSYHTVGQTDTWTNERADILRCIPRIYVHYRIFEACFCPLQRF